MTKDGEIAALRAEKADLCFYTAALELVNALMKASDKPFATAARLVEELGGPEAIEPAIEKRMEYFLEDMKAFLALTADENHSASERAFTRTVLARFGLALKWLPDETNEIAR